MCCAISSSSYHLCNIIFRWWLRISNGPTGILSGERGRGGDCDNGDHRHGNLALVGLVGDLWLVTGMLVPLLMILIIDFGEEDNGEMSELFWYGHSQALWMYNLVIFGQLFYLAGVDWWTSCWWFSAIPLNRFSHVTSVLELKYSFKGYILSRFLDIAFQFRGEFFLNY